MAKRGREPEPATPADWVLGLVNAAVDLVPGARLLRRGFEAVERHLLRGLKLRLEQLEPAKAEAPETNGEASRAPHTPPNVPATPAALLAALLDRSVDQSPEQARGDAFVAILRQLVPDETRILAALSDGGAHPVVHVTAGSALGSSTRILSNVSSVGQAAGIQLREMTPHYIAHLRQLALVELGAEDPGLALKYEILESHTQIREAIAKTERRGRMTRARIVRRTIRLTPLGRDLWAACQADEAVASVRDESR